MRWVDAEQKFFNEPHKPYLDFFRKIIQGNRIFIKTEVEYFFHRSPVVENHLLEGGRKINSSLTDKGRETGAESHKRLLHGNLLLPPLGSEGPLGDIIK